MISFDEARRHVLGEVSQLAEVVMDLDDAAGLVLAADVLAGAPVPPFANSAMDGFAVRAADSGVGARLAVVGTAAAGVVVDRCVGPGEAIRIMTGAPIPEGADTVIMVERTAVDGDVVVLDGAVEVGTAVRLAGDDLRPGDVALGAGAALGPAALGVCATVDARRLTVVPRVRVGVFSTGDELVEAPTPLGPGQIRDSNRRALLAACVDLGCEVVDLGLVPDDPEQIRAALLNGVAVCDAVVTSGGVSMGDFDFVKAVLDEIGDMRWMQIAIKPAKPLAVGTVRSGERTVPVFGLPGNPVSSLVSLELFARPALRKMMGHSVLDRPRVIATAPDGLPRRPDGKIHFVRVRLSGGDGPFEVRSLPGQGSHHMAAMAAANALAVLADGEGVGAGGTCAVIPLGEPW